MVFLKMKMFTRVKAGVKLSGSFDTDPKTYSSSTPRGAPIGKQSVGRERYNQVDMCSYIPLGHVLCPQVYRHTRLYPKHGNNHASYVIRVVPIAIRSSLKC